MEWHKLFSDTRLCRPDAAPQKGRSPFQQDIDRITFSAAFRRLAHKTQVHPLSTNDHVHTRLTHSIEAASVGRSLGTGVGEELAPRIGKQPTITRDTFGYVVQAACLAHDIGNPPFGHSGEHAIQSWFKAQKTNPSSRLFRKLHEMRYDDFTLFDGNAQGFRTITQLEDAKWAGGLQLTHAVLGTLMKYPCASTVVTDDYIGAKKPGFFGSEENYFRDVADNVSLQKRDNDAMSWSRHPLAFLVEAADDICYKIIDIEDGYELGYLSFVEAKDILWAIANDGSNLTALPAQESDQIGKLRAVSVGIAVNECIRVFMENNDEIVEGRFNHPLVELTKIKDQLHHASEMARARIFSSEAITRREITGATVIEGLLDIFAEVIVDLIDVEFQPKKLRGNTERLARLMGKPILRVDNPYSALLCLTDFVSGMTDRFAVDTCRTLKGISL